MRETDVRTGTVGPNMTMAGMGGAARGNMGMPATAAVSQPGSQQRTSMPPTRTSSGNIPPPNAPTPSSAPGSGLPPSAVSPMRMVNMNNSGLNNSSGGLGMAGMGTGMGGVPPMGMNSMVMGNGMTMPGNTMSGIAVNSMGAGMSGGMNMGMPGYAQTLQGMGNKAALMKDKQANLVQQQQLLQQQLLQQQGYDHDQDHPEGREHHDLAESSPMPPAQPPTQAQLLRQSLNGINTHASHIHAPQHPVAPPSDSSSFDSGFPALSGTRPSSMNFSLLFTFNLNQFDSQNIPIRN